MSDENPMADYNTNVIEQFRAGGGTVPGFEHMALLLLHHTGAKSGTERVQPLAYMEDGGRYVIFASKAGAPTNPAWYYNLLAHPDVSIELGDRTLGVHAQELTGDERQRLFEAVSASTPQFAEYAKKTDRVIPVIGLQPVS
jgi:deazaflavin-dependent oxidoreductase (nitroreductase family)